MTERRVAAWLLRRAAFGPGPGDLDDVEGRSVDDLLDRLVDPGAHGVDPAPDPWRDVSFTAADLADDGVGKATRRVAKAWLVAMVDTPRPLEEWLRWFWHGHFVVEGGIVRQPQMVVDHLRTLGRYGSGDLRSLLRAVTVDPAMLLYLDGASSQRKRVNENYGREVLELFTLGVGRFGEDDVRAAATALTGWHPIDNRKVAGPAVFTPARHDDSPQRLLGRSGVHDVDTVVDAIVEHPACAPFITAQLVKALLGPDVERGLIDSLARRFATNGLQITPLVREILEAGAERWAARGTGGEPAAPTLVRAPVPWFVATTKAAGLPATEAVDACEHHLAAAGQIPLAAPNVSGWPEGAAWFAPSATAARWTMATLLAPKVHDRFPGDHRRWADALGYPDGFSRTTEAAIEQLRRDGKGDDAARALAMAAPEAVFA